MLAKIAFFDWYPSLGKILNMDNLRKHGLIVMDWGYMFKKSSEYVNHLALVMPETVVYLFAC